MMKCQMGLKTYPEGVVNNLDQLILLGCLTSYPRYSVYLLGYRLAPDGSDRFQTNILKICSGQI